MKDALVNGFKTLRRGSVAMLVPVLVLLVLGILFVYSSCYVSDDQEVRPLYERQIVWAIAGLISYVAFALYDFHRFKRIAWGVYGSSLVLLVLVLFMGRTIYGAKRWLMLFGDNGIGIQPSEIAKLATIVLLGHRLSETGRILSDPREVATTLALVAVPVVLIMKQPDLGTALVFVPTAFLMMFVAGIPFRYLGSLVAIGATAVALLLGGLFLPERLGASEATQARVRSLTGLSEYQRGRIEVFFQPDKDPLGAGWNKRQSEIAVGSGGLWGKGYLHGTQNILGFLPRSVAPTDFIYSVIAEEKGFVGSLMVLALFGFVL
ncbi:MAG: FtsW/RodA/SpoVE family cell cycle protein, partial [Verrucomicrobia bacterium]|nr:FtsW/RodA/SpoVE family cell cycle protein [Verrucomicrobiota bacterium]